MPDSPLAVKETCCSDFGFRTFSSNFANTAKRRELTNTGKPQSVSFMGNLASRLKQRRRGNAESSLCSYKRSQQRRCDQEASGQFADFPPKDLWAYLGDL